MEINSYSDIKALPEGRFIWQGMLDDRLLVVAIRSVEDAYRGELLIFKFNMDLPEGEETAEEPILYRQEVGIMFGAPFGPDFDDVTHWQNIAIKYADQETAKLSDLLPDQPAATDAAQVKHLDDVSVSKTEE